MKLNDVIIADYLCLLKLVTGEDFTSAHIWKGEKLTEQERIERQDKAFLRVLKIDETLSKDLNPLGIKVGDRVMLGIDDMNAVSLLNLQDVGLKDTNIKNITANVGVYPINVIIGKASKELTIVLDKEELEREEAHNQRIKEIKEKEEKRIANKLGKKN